MLSRNAIAVVLLICLLINTGATAGDSAAEDLRGQQLEVLRNSLRSFVTAQQAYYHTFGRYGSLHELQRPAQLGDQHVPPFMNADFAAVIADNAGALFIAPVGIGGQSFSASVTYLGADPLCYQTDASGLLHTILPASDAQ